MTVRAMIPAERGVRALFGNAGVSWPAWRGTRSAHYAVRGGRRALSVIGSMPEPVQAKLVGRVLAHV